MDHSIYDGPDASANAVAQSNNVAMVTPLSGPFWQVRQQVFGLTDSQPKIFDVLTSTLKSIYRTPKALTLSGTKRKKSVDPSNSSSRTLPQPCRLVLGDSTNTMEHAPPAGLASLPGSSTTEPVSLSPAQDEIINHGSQQSRFHETDVPSVHETKPLAFRTFSNGRRCLIEDVLMLPIGTTLSVVWKNGTNEILESSFKEDVLLFERGTPCQEFELRRTSMLELPNLKVVTNDWDADPGKDTTKHFLSQYYNEENIKGLTLESESGTRILIPWIDVMDCCLEVWIKCGHFSFFTQCKRTFEKAIQSHPPLFGRLKIELEGDEMQLGALEVAALRAKAQNLTDENKKLKKKAETAASKQKKANDQTAALSMFRKYLLDEEKITIGQILTFS